MTKFTWTRRVPIGRSYHHAQHHLLGEAGGLGPEVHVATWSTQADGRGHGRETPVLTVQKPGRASSPVFLLTAPHPSSNTLWLRRVCGRRYAVVPIRLVLVAWSENDNSCYSLEEIKIESKLSVHSACVTRVVTYKGWTSKGLSICWK